METITIGLGTTANGSITGKRLLQNQVANSAPADITPFGSGQSTLTLTLQPGEADFLEVPVTTTNTTYPSSGSITLTHDFSSSVTWTSVSLAETKPAGTNITYQYQSSTDNVNWSAASSDISTLADGRYIRVVATLTTTNNSVTPSLDKLTINYDAVNVPPPPSSQIPAATAAHTVDGVLNESDWNLSTPVAKTVLGTSNNTVTYGSLWDNNYLYVGVKVLDANLNNDSGANVWDDDSVEVYVDPTNAGGTTYTANDRQFVQGWNNATLFEAGGHTTGVQHAWTAIAGGYTVELAIPWSNLGVMPSTNMNIGFDVANNDDDNAGARDSQAVWAGTINDYQDPSGFGKATLTGTPIIPPTDTTPPTVSLTSPAPGATVSGSSVNVSATANDNDVVASVQFQLDGGNLGPLYTASPYATTLNTTTLANGNHTLSAIAKDASGNSSPPASITINVNNVTIPPPDTQAPTTPASLHSTGTTSSSITLAWNASSDTGGSGLAGYKLYRNGALITQTTSLSYTDTGLTANTGYLYKISAIDNAGNESGQSLAVNVSTANVVTTPTITQNLTGGQTLSGTVTWTASVTSGASSISKIEFAMDGNTNNTTVNAPGPYQRILDTTKLTNSTHNLGLTVTLTDGTVVWQPYQIGNVTVSNTTSPPQPPPPPPVTPGSSNPDLDGNGIVDIFDLSKLLSNYGKSGVGDLDGNGIVDIFDLSRLLAQYKG
jgi:hypothetical protein